MVLVRAYDIIEKFNVGLEQSGALVFEDALNAAFVEEGVGWQLVEGQIVTRGGEGFQEAVKTAAEARAPCERIVSDEFVDGPDQVRPLMITVQERITSDPNDHGIAWLARLNPRGNQSDQKSFFVTRQNGMPESSRGCTGSSGER